MPLDLPEIADLLARARGGDAEALGALLERHRARLHRMVRLRLDPRLARRVDASDVMQEVDLEAVRRFAEYPGSDKIQFFLWLRSLTRQKPVACRSARR